jgi:predicted DNA-binding protein (UPF0251 family)
MTEPAYKQLTEASIKEALIEARGDIFIASQLLGVTAMRVHRAIQIHPVLQTIASESKAAGEGIPAKVIAEAIEARLQLYRVAGLDELHALATMEISENSAQNQVKLAAAARLAGETSHGSVGGELAEALRDLNVDYHQNAPRIRVVRQTLVEISPQTQEPVGRVVDQQSIPSE